MFDLQMIQTEIFKQVLKRGPESLKRSIRFALMCLEVNLKNKPKSQSDYVRNSIEKNHCLNDKLEQNGFTSFRSLVNSGKLKLL